MSQEHALGLAITGTEITLLLIDAANHDVVGSNRVALPAEDATLPDLLDRLVESAPFPAQRVAVACTDPTVQILLTDRARRVDAPRWLAHATIISSTAALTAAVSSQLPYANPLVVVLLDHHGRTETAVPLMLIDPGLATVIDTAQAPGVHLPAYERAGADALADAMAALPVVGLGVDVIVAAGAGAEIHGVIQEMSRATGLPVQEIGGRYSVAFGAALGAAHELPMPAHGRSQKTRPSHLAVAVIGLSTVLLAGGLAVAVAQHPGKKAPTLSDSSQPVTSTSTSTAGNPPPSTSEVTQAPPTRSPSLRTGTGAPSTTETPAATTTQSPSRVPATADSTTRRQIIPNQGRPPATTEREASTRPIYTPPPVYTPPTRTTTPPTRTPTSAPDESENADSSVPDAAPSS